MSHLFIRRGPQVEELAPSDFASLPTDTSFCWLHIDGADADARNLLTQAQGIPDLAIAALQAQETRPRCASFGDGALVNLRGLGMDTDDSGDPLVSIRIWAQKGLAISLSFRRLSIFDDLVKQMKEGSLDDPGDLIAATAMKITDALDPDVADLGDTLDSIECRVLDEGQVGVRHKVSSLRSEAIGYRRFLAPQRQALERLMTLQESWLQPDDRVHLQEAADRGARMVEELESMRERAALVHDALTDLRAEHMNKQGLILSIVALIFLPLTFVTGLLGMNVAGIPLSTKPWAFWGVVLFCLIVGAVMTFWFKATNWIRK